MFLPLLALTLGVMVADAGKVFYEVQEQQHMPADDWQDEPENLPEAAENLAAKFAFASVDVNTALSPFGKVWCDSKWYCQSGQTCCRRSKGKWGCCPFTGGTCCKKGKVCCPQGKRCSNPPGQCF